MNVEPEVILYRDHIFKLVDVDIEDEVELDLSDWVDQNFCFDENGQLKVTISMDLPNKASTFWKGRIAEYFGAELLNSTVKNQVRMMAQSRIHPNAI